MIAELVKKLQEAENASREATEKKNAAHTAVIEHRQKCKHRWIVNSVGHQGDTKLPDVIELCCEHCHGVRTIYAKWAEFYTGSNVDDKIHPNAETIEPEVE